MAGGGRERGRARIGGGREGERGESAVVSGSRAPHEDRMIDGRWVERQLIPS